MARKKGRCGEEGCSSSCLWKSGGAAAGPSNPRAAAAITTAPPPPLPKRSKPGSGGANSSSAAAAGPAPPANKKRARAPRAPPVTEFFDPTVDAPALAELAAEIGVPAEGLAASVARFNSFCESGIDAELIDLRTIVPLDIETIAESVKKTGRCVVVHEATKTGGFGADYTFEATGLVSVMEQAVESARMGWGLCTVAGVAGKGETLDIIPRWLITGRRVCGSSFGGVKGRDQVPQLIDRYLEGEIDVDPFISHSLSLGEVNRGFELMEAQDGIRSVIAFS